MKKTENLRANAAEKTAAWLRDEAIHAALFEAPPCSPQKNPKRFAAWAKDRPHNFYVIDRNDALKRIHFDVRALKAKLAARYTRALASHAQDALEVAEGDGDLALDPPRLAKELRRSQAPDGGGKSELLTWRTDFLTSVARSIAACVARRAVVKLPPPVVSTLPSGWQWMSVDRLAEAIERMGDLPAPDVATEAERAKLGALRADERRVLANREANIEQRRIDALLHAGKNAPRDIRERYTPQLEKKLAAKHRERLEAQGVVFP